MATEVPQYHHKRDIPKVYRVQLIIINVKCLIILYVHSDSDKNIWNYNLNIGKYIDDKSLINDWSSKEDGRWETI